MAETKKGNKFVEVGPYAQKQGGKTIKVPKHDRSTPKTSAGKSK